MDSIDQYKPSYSIRKKAKIAGHYKEILKLMGEDVSRKACCKHRRWQGYAVLLKGYEQDRKRYCCRQSLRRITGRW